MKSIKVLFQRLTSHKRLGLLIGFILFIPLFWGCYFWIQGNVIQQGSMKPAVVVNYFTVVSTSPGDASSDNPANTPIKITFNEPVRPDSLRGYFTVSPMIPGTFTQGDSPNEVVFQTKYPLGEGTSVKIILNKGLESVAGNKLTSDYTYNFATKILDTSVVFESEDFFARWVNVPTGKGITFNLRVGPDVSPDGTITVYKSTFDFIVSSLLYKNETHKDTNYVTQTYIDYPVNTSKLQKVSVTQGIKNHSSFAFSQGEGLYYIEAKSNGQVVGSTWVNVNDEGLIVRQDDQKVTLATQNIKTGNIESKVKVLLYNLEDKPTLVKVAQIERYGEIPIEYPQKVDLVVGETAHGVILVPLTIPETQADIRVNSNLTNADKILLYTDKPTYLAQDTVKFGGILRRDNDAKYTVPAVGDKVRVWIADPDDTTQKLVDQTVVVGEGGVFSGQFTLPTALTTAIDKSASFILYAKAVSDTAKYVNSKSYVTFDVVSQASSALLAVHFDKKNYTKNEAPVAHIVGVDSAGKPLAHKAITYTVYTRNYYEDDPESVADFGNQWGEKTDQANEPLTLDADGKADVTIDKADSTVSRAVTLEAATDADGVSIYGAKTVLVQQGNIVLTFGASRQTYHTGDTVISRVYANDLSNKPSPNLDLKYQVYTSLFDNEQKTYKETVLAEGTAKTDTNGFALITQSVTTQSRSVTMRVLAKDTVDNSIQVERSVDILPADVQPSSIYYHNFTLSNLDVAMDKLQYQVGDTANLTINVSFDQTVLVTYESGRIYHNEWLKLSKGDNSYKINISSQLSPSFNLVFSYFHNESLFIEGVPMTVSDASKNVSVQVVTDKNQYAKNDSAQITILTKDTNGQPTKATVLVNILEDTIFNLRDTVPNGNVGWYFYSPRLATTNFSASTLGIGSGGGCGGGSGVDIQYVPNRIGKNIFWNPSFVTDQNGELKVTVPLPDASGTFRVLITALDAATAVGQSQSLLLVE